MQLATVLTCRKPVHRGRIGEILRDCRGPWSVACNERSIRNLGGPSTSSDLPIGGRTYQPQEECPMGQWSPRHIAPPVMKGLKKFKLVA